MPKNINTVKKVVYKEGEFLYLKEGSSQSPRYKHTPSLNLPKFGVYVVISEFPWSGAKSSTIFIKHINNATKLPADLFSEMFLPLKYFNDVTERLPTDWVESMCPKETFNTFNQFRRKMEYIFR